jgi:hypothetical protein
MYFVYDLRRDGFVVYTGLTTDPGRSLSRHLAQGKLFDTLQILERLPRLEDAKLAAQRRRYKLNAQRGAPRAAQPGRGIPTGAPPRRTVAAPYAGAPRNAVPPTRARPA